MKTLKTTKGTDLPLINLKGKDYLMVAYRLLWLTEDVERFNIVTDLPVLTDEQTVARATVQLFNKEGTLVRSATATKRETKKDFSDHTEKAETAAVGRALAMLGFGTQQALADLDEGSRLADAPLTSVKVETKSTVEPVKATTSSFRRTEAKSIVSVKPETSVPEVKAEETAVGWE